MTNEPTNADRAEWAREALAIFTVRTFGGDRPDTMHRNDLECAISDLMADLMHYARQHGFDANALLHQACSNFELELLDEAGRS